MIRPDELRAIREGRLDLAFRRWDRPRVRVGTRMRTAVGLVEVTSLDRVAPSSLRAQDARRAGAASLAALREAAARQPERDLWRIGLVWAGADPREALRAQVPDDDEVARLVARLDRLDAAARSGPWTREALRLVDEHPAVRAPDLAVSVGRPTAEFKTDVRKLKELGLTESLAIGYRLSPRGERVVDHLRAAAGEPPRVREPRPVGTPLPRTIGASATRALLAAGVSTLEEVAALAWDDVAALRGVGPVALARLREALADAGGVTGPRKRVRPTGAAPGPSDCRASIAPRPAPGCRRAP